MSLILCIFFALPFAISAQINSAVISGDAQPCPGSANYSVAFPAIPNGFVLDRIEWQAYSVVPIITFTSSVAVTIPSDPDKRNNGIVASIYKKNSNDGTTSFHASGQLTLTARAYSPKLSIQSSMEYVCGVQQFSVSVSDYPADQANFGWGLPSGWTIISGQNTPTIIGETSAGSGGVLSLSLTDSKCGQNYYLTSTITRPPAPAIGAISGGAGCFCAGQTQSFSVPVVSGATSYQWAASGSLSIVGGQGTNTVSVGTSGSGGNLTCYAVTACGNTNTSSSNFIPTASAPPPAPVVTVMSNPCANYQRPGTLRVTNVADICTNYIWSGDAGVMISSGLDLASVEVPGFGYGVSVYGVNPCGTSAATSRSIPVDPNCPGPLRVAPLGITTAPNPFSDRTTLSYTLSEDAEVTLDVTTPVGKRIVSLINERQKAGDHDVTFDGSRLPTGVYVATLTVTTRGGERQTASVQMTLTR